MDPRETKRTKARHTKAALIGLMLLVGLSVGGTLVVAEHSQDREDLDEHCPDHQGHPGKVEASGEPASGNETILVNGDLVNVLIEGQNVTFRNATTWEPIEVEFCIKAADKAGGMETGSEGHVSWETMGGQIPDISYVVVYRVVEPVNGPEPCIGPQWINGTAHASPPTNEIEWDSFPNATGYALYRATEGGPFTLLTQTDANTTAFNDTAVEVGTTYQYEVAAKLNGEESDRCDQVEVTAIPVFTSLVAAAAAAAIGIGAYAVSRRKD